MEIESNQPLNLLEQRFIRLEQKLVGKDSINELDMNKVKPVTNALHEVDTVLISSISGRDKISTLLKKVDILQKLFDTSYLDSFDNIDAEIEAILQSETDVNDYVNNLSRLEGVHSVLDDETVQHLSNLTDKINQLISDTLKIKEQCDKQTAVLTEMASTYDNCVIQVSSWLAQMEAIITQMEIDSQPKTPFE